MDTGEIALAGLDLLVDFGPVAVADGLGFEVGEHWIYLHVLAQDVLNVLKGGILPHAAGHLLGHLDETVDRGPDLARLYAAPEDFPQFVQVPPNGRAARPTRT